MMKKGILFLLVGGLGAGATFFFWPLPDPTAQANHFLRLLAEGQIDEAYALTTPQFHLLASKGELLVKSQRLGLNQYVESTWTTTSRPHPTTVNLAGAANLASGTVIQIEMRLRQLEGEWRVDFLGKSRGDLELPAREELTRLVTSTMVDLGESIAKEDFGVFRSKCSRSLQLMNTEDELRRSFAKIDYSFVRELSPEFSKAPHLDSQGNLHLIGHYPTSPSRMEFLMNYTFEQPDWRLTMLHVHLVDIYEKQAERFVQFLAQSQYAEAYQLTSSEFREHADEQMLKQVAAQLKLDRNARPKWTNQDSVDDLVRLDGKVLTRDGKDLQVRVGMILEGSDWKVHYMR